MNNQILKMLNDQYNGEVQSAFMYFQIAADLENKGYINSAKLFVKHYREELTHADKFYRYLLDIKQRPTLQSSMVPNNNQITSLKQALELTLKAEEDTTKVIHSMVEAALQAKDWRTFEFLQWFVKEQIEEEKLLTDLLKQHALCGDELEADQLLETYLESHE